MKRLLLIIITVAFFCGTVSCKTINKNDVSDIIFDEEDKGEIRYRAPGSIDGFYHGIEGYATAPYVFTGEFTGNIIKNRDGFYYREFHVLEKIRGDVEDYILIYSYFYHGYEASADFPFRAGEKYLMMTSSYRSVYHDAYYRQGVLYCPIERFEDSFMVVLGEGKRLDFMSTASKDNFKDYDSFLAYIKNLLEKNEATISKTPYYIESDDIYDIIKAAPQILKIKVLGYDRNNENNHLENRYFCIVEKVYKGDYDRVRGSLTLLYFDGEKSIQYPGNDYKHYFSFTLFVDDVDLEKTDEYIICSNSHSLIARKGTISLDYTEEEIIDMITEIYGEINILDIPEGEAYCGYN